MGLTEQQTNFIEKYLTIGQDRKDPAYVRRKRKDLYSDINHADNDAVKIAARKKVSTVERHRLMAELAVMIRFVKPDLVVADRHDPLVDHVRAVYKEYKHQIESVSENQRYRPARDKLREIEAEMDVRFSILLDEITETEMEGGEPLAEIAAGKSVVIWKRDLGADLRAHLGGTMDLLEVGAGELQISLNEAILDGFAEDNDRVTPHALQGEVESIYQDALSEARNLVDTLGPVERQLRQDIADGRSGEDISDYYNSGLQKFVSSQIVPGMVRIVVDLKRQIHANIVIRWKQVVARRESVKKRPLKLVLNFVLPVVGIGVAATGIALGVLLTTTGIGAVAGVGIVLASVAIARGLVSIAKNAYEEIASIKYLTEGMKKDLDSLADSYGRASGVNEISASVLNSFVAWPVMKCLPSVESRMDEIEMRIALVTSAQNRLLSEVERAMAALSEDRVALKRELVSTRGAATDADIDELMEPASDAITKLLDQIANLGKKTLPLQQFFARIRQQLDVLSGLVSDKVKSATRIIPVVVELAFLVANVSVGLAGALTAATMIEQAVGSAVALTGEVTDGAATINTAADS